tara:strand:- start:784 stop:1194 length:411 start_codon:yes stop_codon:yes gene_type:complete
MKIGIIKQGFIGSTIREGLKSFHEVITYDTIKEKCNSTHKDLCSNADIVFVCLPTPMSAYGSCEKRIGRSHLSVPGPDEALGFGGHCFPKDLAAMTYFGPKNAGDASFLKAVQEYNSKCRKFKDWEQMKGRDVSDD